MESQKYCLKFKNKLNYIMVILLGLIIVFNFAQAYFHGYSEKELIINDIIGNVFIFLLLASVPMFIFGVIRDSKNKKNKKNFSLIGFLGLAVACFFFIFITILVLTVLFMNYIYYFYPYYLTYIGIGIFLFILHLLARISTKILNADIYVMISLIIIISFSLITRMI